MDLINPNPIVHARKPNINKVAGVLHYGRASTTLLPLPQTCAMNIMVS
jgi:hypothetical protein